MGHISSAYMGAVEEAAEVRGGGYPGAQLGIIAPIGPTKLCHSRCSGGFLDILMVMIFLFSS